MNSAQTAVAIVTGAFSGIGLGMALALIKHGYDVVATSRTISESKDIKSAADLVLIDGDISNKETASAVLADQPSRSVRALLALLSKSTMPAVSKALALEYAADNIRFNTVSSGTPIGAPVMGPDRI